MTAAERVEASRARLRDAMAPKRPPARATSRAGAGRVHGPSLWRRLRLLPAMGLVVDSVSAWWSRHPMRPVAQVAGVASNAAVRPLAQRSPWTLVLVAAAVGASLGWLRPWRWLFGSALFAGLVPQLATQVVRRLPLESWMDVLNSSVFSKTARASPSARPAADEHTPSAR